MINIKRDMLDVLLFDQYSLEIITFKVHMIRVVKVIVLRYRVSSQLLSLFVQDSTIEFSAHLAFLKHKMF